jgi:SHS2 domain-containing protein
MYRWAEHTSELELEIVAPSEHGVFERGFDAMRELLARESDDDEPAAPPRLVSISARDHAALLAEWLTELAFLAESEGLVPEWLASLELGDNELRAVVEGRRGSPPHLVKAATYHRLSLRSVGGGWRATVVLDV